MKTIRWLEILLFFIILSGCSAITELGPKPLATNSVEIISPPDVKKTMRTYLEAFAADDYGSMYEMISQANRDSISGEDFADLHNNARNTMSAGSLDYEILSAQVSNPYTAQVSFRIDYHTALVGEISRDMLVHLNLKDDTWKLEWDQGLILPELAGGGKRLAMDYKIPARGDIYDVNGEVIVNQSNAVALGIIPGQMNDKSSGTLINELSKLCIINPDDIRDEVASAGLDWYIPICEGSVDEAERILALNPGGLVVTPYEARFYHQSLASQIVGYTQFISEENFDEYRRDGYRGDERVGSAGIEKWAEEYLAGKHGGSLLVIDENSGQIVSRLGSSDPQPAASIYLTIDSNMQFYAQQALTGFRGAIVVLERDSGRVMAMAASPGYDANLFEPNNFNNSLLENLLNDGDQPLVNRAAQGQYPLGSVFKVITFSAALESGLFLPETTYDCQYEWTGLNDKIRYDWTWQKCQDAVRAGEFCNTSSTTPSGLLTLPEGLMRSCNPWFWQIGLDLYNFDRGSDIANMARAFGLGVPTGIEQIAEATGQITNPAGLVQAVNTAIGQGDVLVTPLQTAVMFAAIGNGGTVYRPQLVERIQPIEGDPTTVFKPEARATLPIRAENLEILQKALVSVVENTLGTANFRLRGMNIPAAGKTGTAESGSAGGDPHAWFAGYTDCADKGDELPGCSEKPDIAVAVIVENIGDGSEYAGPMFRRMLQVHYLGSPQSLFWWEKSFGVPKTPTPIGGIPTRTKKPDND
ncbi:MAG: penicillin-binding transpeptidase domain-containing protein [Anaerolineae bacterium]|nr:penicillin-binding transpeptidase domain-containing protein [Anaerolineae bacterium]MDK1081170.1 penicillin-binding transpeptidase domain-containing protein [Anaerolineae bacterium]